MFHKFTLDVTYVQIGVQLVTKVCYYLEFSYINKHLIINKKALCLIAVGCTSGEYITKKASGVPLRAPTEQARCHGGKAMRNVQFKKLI